MILRNHDVLVALAHQPGPVSDGASQEATVDEIKGFMVRPFGLDVIHFETDIGRNPN